MENNVFKGSLFGGFNRQDVMNYIEKASRESAQMLQENQERISALEKQLQEAQAECAALREQLREKSDALQTTQDELSAKAALLEQTVRRPLPSKRCSTRRMNTAP